MHLPKVMYCVLIHKVTLQAPFFLILEELTWTSDALLSDSLSHPPVPFVHSCIPWQRYHCPVEILSGLEIVWSIISVIHGSLNTHSAIAVLTLLEVSPSEMVPGSSADPGPVFDFRVPA